MKELLDLFFQSFSFKFGIAIILSLIMAFSGEIKLLRNLFVMLTILMIFAMLLVFNFEEDVGIILLMGGLFAMSYNKHAMQSIQN